MANAEIAPGPYSALHLKRDAMYILHLWGEGGNSLPRVIAGHFSQGDFRAAEAVSWLMSSNDRDVTTKDSKNYYYKRGRPENSIIVFQKFIQRFRSGPCRDIFESLPGATFIPFSRLPVELRTKIWTLALPNHPRFVEIQTTGAKIPVDDNEDNEVNEDNEDHEKYFGTKTWRPICKVRPPALLFVCQESRIVVKDSYLAVEGNEPGSPTVYCNVARDIFCFSYTGFHPRVGPFVRRFFAKTGHKINYLALEYSTWGDCWPTRSKDLLNYLDLKELMIANDMTGDREPSDRRIIGFDKDDELEDPDAWYCTALASLREEMKGLREQSPNWEVPQTMTGEFILN